MAEFTYNASALGAGGVIKRGEVTTVIPSIASVALAPTGGRGTSVANYTSAEMSIGYAETRVTGEETAEGEFTTHTFVLIRDLNLFGRLAVKQMVASVTSTRGLDPDDDHAFEVAIGYEGVALDGDVVIPDYDGDVRGCLRYADLKQLLSTDAKQSALLTTLNVDENETLQVQPDEELTLKQLLNQQLLNGKAVRAPVVKALKCNGQLVGNGHVLPIQGIGVARFGELMFKPGRRRLNLLRLQLNDDLGWIFPAGGTRESTTVQRMMSITSGTESLNGGPGGGGSLTVASVEGNGSLLVP